MFVNGKFIFSFVFCLSLFFKNNSPPLIIDLSLNPKKDQVFYDTKVNTHNFFNKDKNIKRTTSLYGCELCEISPD